jgi:integrase
MAYQRGSLRIVSRKGGDVWMLRYRLNTADGKRKENTLPVGLLRDFPTEKAAWREVDRLGLLIRINSEESATRTRFNTLAEYYLKADFGDDAVRPKSVNTIPIVEHYVRDYLIARWGNELAGAISPLDIQRWLKSLHVVNGLAWTTVSKIRGIMHRVYKVGILHERVDKNPVEHVETRSQSLYKAVVITPQQTLAILNKLTNPLHYMLVLTCAATALRASEIVSLRWSDILWNDGQIRISKRWAKGEDGETKTAASNGYVPMHPVLAEYLKEWRAQSPYSKVDDFRLSVAGKGRQGASIGVDLRAGPSAAGGSKRWRRTCEGATLRSSQPAAQPKHLAREQGEGRSEDCARYVAASRYPHHHEPLHAG